MDLPVTFTVGQNYADVDSVKSALDRYNQQNDTELRITSNNKKSITIICKHGRKRKHEGTGKRPKQHSAYLGCNAAVSIYKSKRGLKVTKVELQHNHVLIPNLPTIDETDEEMILTLADASARPSQIKRVLQEKNKKVVSTKKIRNLISKLKSSDMEDKELFEQFLKDIEENGGEVEWTSDPDGTVKSLFVSSKTMKGSLLKSDPPVVQMDTTFNIDKAQYKLTAFCYLNPLTDKTEVAALALVSTESEENFDFVLSCFRSLNPVDEIVFLVDKDFTCIDSIKRTFPRVTVLLCIFHVLKFVRSLFATAVVLIDKKQAMLQRFKEVVYAHDDDEFNSTNDAFLAEISGVTVTVGKSERDLTDYYNKNWLNCKEMWVKYLRKHLPLLGDHTTNRIERMFWTLKKSLSEAFNSVPKTITSVMHLVKYSDQRITERSEVNTMRSLRIYSSDPFIRDLNEKASLALNDRGCTVFDSMLKNFRLREKKLHVHAEGVLEEFTNKEDQKIGEKVYRTTLTECNCTYRTQFQAPCRHIIFVRLSECATVDETEIFDVGIFNARYHRSSFDADADADIGRTVGTEHVVGIEEVASDLDEELDVEDYRVLSDKEKFNLVMPVLLKLGNLISCHGMNDFYRFFDDLEDFEKCVRRRKRYRFRKNNDTPNFEANEDNDHHTLTSSSTVVASSSLSLTSSSTTTSSSTVLVSSYPSLTSSSTTTSSSAVLVASSLYLMSSTGTTYSSAVATSSSASSTPESVESSRFANIAFKENIKPKSRPKKSTKQVCFKRTTLDKEKELNAKRGGKAGRGGRGRGRGGNTESLLKPKPQFNNLLREVNSINEMTADEMATELLQLPCMTPGWVNNLPSIDVNPSYPSYLSILQDDRSWPVGTILTSPSGAQTSSYATLTSLSGVQTSSYVALTSPDVL